MRTHPDNRHPTTRRGAAIAVLILVLASAPAAGTERFLVRIFGVSQSAAGDEIVVGAPAAADAARFSISDGSAIGLELEYRWRPKVAFELMAHFGDYDAELSPAPGAAGPFSNGSLGSETYTLGVNYLFAHAGRVELTAGVFGGFSYYDDITLSLPSTGQPETFRFDDDLGFGLKLGADLPLGGDGHWLAAGALRYQSSILEGEIAGRDMDVDPLSLTLGVGYRF